MQEHQFFRRRVAPEDRVAMRIATEAADDRGVPFGPFKRAAVARLGGK
jgi:hypothetical protein